MGDTMKQDAQKWIVLLLVAAALVSVFNSYQIGQLKGKLGVSGRTGTSTGTVTQTKSDIVPVGVPKVWGGRARVFL